MHYITDTALENIEKQLNDRAKLLEALRTMLVATNFDAPLPKGHPSHEAYLNTVARPRAKQAISEAERK